MTMMRNCTSVATTFLALLAAVALIPSTTEAICRDTDVNNDIVSIACDASNAATFSTLCALLTDTGIDDQISRNTDFIVFAPTNAAFEAAGNTVGSLIRQQQAVLQYHIYPNAGDGALVCGETIDSLLTWRGAIQTSFTACSAPATFLEQRGDVSLPRLTSSFPAFTNTDNTFIDACNGKIFSIDSVLGFDRVQYNWQPRCSFNDPNCFGAKGGKAGGFNVFDETIDGVTFETIIFRGKGGKGGPGRGPGRGIGRGIGIGRFNNQFYRGGKGFGWRRQLDTNDADADADAYDGGYDYAAAARRAQYADDAEDY